MFLVEMCTTACYCVNVMSVTEIYIYPPIPSLGYSVATGTKFDGKILYLLQQGDILISKNQVQQILYSYLYHG